MCVVPNGAANRMDMYKAEDGGTKIVSSDVLVPKAAIRAFSQFVESSHTLMASY